MDNQYVLQIMRDYGRDIESKGSYKLYDDLTTAHRHFNTYKKMIMLYGSGLCGAHHY